MKAKYVISALALPLIFGACSNEDLITENASTALNGNMIELPQNFTLVGKKTAPAGTRSEMITWDDQNVLAWVPKEVGASLTEAKENWDQIGLAWLNETPGNKVYTNYRFQHYGWLNIDETSAEVDACDASKRVKNGVYYSASATNKFATWNGTSETNVAAFATNYDVNAFTTANVNPANGLFKTDNSTIFTGDYLVYYPFNEDLKEVGYLTATSKKEFTNATTTATDKDAAKYAGDYMKKLAPELFMVGRTSIEGGMQASDFNMGTLSGMIAVKVSNTSDNDLSNIESVVLYAQGNGFLTSAQLDASKIVNSESVKQGTALYVAGGKQETSETLISKASSAVPTLTAADDQYVVFGFAALPTTATKVIAVVQDNAGNSFAQEIGDVTVKPNAWTAIEVNVDKALSNKVLYAYDATSLATAITAAGAATSEETRATIKVLGEIELDADDSRYGYETLIPDYTTIEGGKLVVVPGSKLQTTNTTSIVKSAIDVQGQDCCTKRVAGRLLSFGGVLAGEINVLAGYTGKDAGSIEFRKGYTTNVEGTINNYGSVSVGESTASSQTLVNLSGTINNYGKLTIYKGATGNSTEDAKVAVLANGNFNNKAEGSVTVEGVLAIYPGNATNQGTIYDKVSSQITGNIANLGTEGEYVSDVDNNGIRFEAALIERPTTIIRFVKAGSYQMDKVGAKNETIKKFVVTVANVVFNSKATNASANAPKINTQSIKELEIEEGASLSVTTNKTSNGALHLTVDGTVNVAGTLTISEAADRGDVVFNAGTMNVEKTLTIGKAVSCKLGSLNIAKSAAATFSVNSITDVEGAIVNNGTATITLATGSGSTDISARVWYHNVAPSGDGVWANGTPTQAL